RESEAEARESEAEARDSEAEARDSEGQARDSEGQARDSEGQARDSEGQARESEAEARDGEGEVRESDSEVRESDPEARPERREDDLVGRAVLGSDRVRHERAGFGLAKPGLAERGDGDGGLAVSCGKLEIDPTEGASRRRTRGAPCSGLARAGLPRASP